jgi:hypothetical protein
MRARVAVSVLVWAVAACADMAPRVGYAPPADRPSKPGPGYVDAASADLIWNQLLDRLQQSGLQVDLADPQRGVMVATYSGDAAPYVTCGSILLDDGGEPERIDASSQATFHRVVRGRPVEIERDLKLDARLAVEAQPRGGEAFVAATGNYVLTKTVVAEGGRQRGRAYEIVSFSTGERGAFSKGTVCQPNGALERTVLDIMPAAAQVAQAARARPMTTRRAKIVRTEIASHDSVPQSSPSDLGQQAALSNDPPDSPAAGDDPARQPPDCTIADKTFCAVLEITDPWRRANEQQGLGLEVKRIEPGNPLVEGGDFGLDISLPAYDAYLAVSFFLRDGTVRHVLSGRNAPWPANAREFVGDPGLGTEQRGNVEMVVAVASDAPLFASPRPPAEAASSYLADLRGRLAEMSGADAARIAASLLVITPTPPQPS